MEKKGESETGQSQLLHPLVVDLDGTLLKTDILHEGILFCIRELPIADFLRLVTSARTKLDLKKKVAKVYKFNPARLPYNSRVLELVSDARNQGRVTVLLTASLQEQADAVNKHLNLFEIVVGSSTTNLKGKAKLDWLQSKFGLQSFDFIGDNSSDIPAFLASRQAILVSNSRFLIRRFTKLRSAHSRELSAILDNKDSRLGVWKRQLRVSQWIKNLLVAAPMFLAINLQPTSFLGAISAFLSMSLAASSQYILNDIIDLGADRENSVKKNRPLAAGEIKIVPATIVAFVLITLALVVALLSAGIAAILAIFAYFLLSSWYSINLKKFAVLDVATLSILYNWRFIVGGIFTQTTLTFWFLTFGFFVFLSLAILKRSIEVLLENDKTIAVNRREYDGRDLPFLSMSGLGTGLVSVVMLIVYMNLAGEIFFDLSSLGALSTITLWTFWILRTWRLGLRGVISQDPVKYSISEPVSIATLILAIASFLVWRVT